MRNYRTSQGCLCKEKGIESLIQQRVCEMLCYPSGPIEKILHVSRKVLKDLSRDNASNNNVMILGTPGTLHLGTLVAQEFPAASIHVQNEINEMELLELDRSDDFRHLTASDVIDLSDYENNTFDLIITCFGLDVRNLTT